MVQSPNKYADIFKNNNIYLLFHIETPTLIWMTKKKLFRKPSVLILLLIMSCCFYLFALFYFFISVFVDVQRSQLNKQH